MWGQLRWCAARQDAYAREEISRAIGGLQEEAGDEIDRLVQFIDKTNAYVFRELGARSTTIRACFSNSPLDLRLQRILDDTVER